MDKQQSPYEAQPPSKRRIFISTLFAACGALVILLLIVLPAEYGLDPTGFGRLTGLAQLTAPTQSIQISDVIGGNEVIREVEIPQFGEPTPLPNPAVFQDQDQPPRTETLQIEIPSEGETEIKVQLQEGKVVLYSWSVDRGDIYVDFHGHDPSFGPDFFVRYKEQQEGSGNNGSLTAPFSGEHGWYWLNYNEYPVTVTLRLMGYYDEVIDYGIFN